MDARFARILCDFALRLACGVRPRTSFWISIGGDAVKDREPTCAKCGSAMEAGFVLDQTHDAVMRQSAWIEGAPEPSFWTGLKLKGHQRLPVTTYRCCACGYLESYAPPA